MTNEEAPKFPKNIHGLHEESHAAKLLDADGQVLSTGRATLSSEESTVTFYLGDHSPADTISLRATILFLSAGQRIAIAQGRTCSCSGPLHIHFEKALGDFRVHS